MRVRHRKYDQRQAHRGMPGIRRKLTTPQVAELEARMRNRRAGLSWHAAEANAINCMLKRWVGLQSKWSGGVMVTSTRATGRSREFATQRSDNRHFKLT